MSDLRIVLKECVSNDDISRLAWQQSWELDGICPRTEKTPLTKIWTTPDEQTGIHYIEYFYINARYILIQGKNQDKIAEKIRAIKGKPLANGCLYAKQLLNVLGASTTGYVN